MMQAMQLSSEDRLENNIVTEAKVAHCKRIAFVIQMTQEMMLHADNSEWERVAELELQRRDDLMACFSTPVTLDDSDLIAEAIAALLHLNEELMAKLKVARDEVMEQGVSMTRNRSALSSYQMVDESR